MVLSQVGLVALVALVGGALGAALGANRALVLAGVAIVVGELARWLDVGPEALAETFGVAIPPLDAAGMTGTVGFGVLGPHVAFAGGVAAAATLGRREVLDSSFEYHQAKCLTAPLYDRPRALVVGGVFGLFGVFLAGLVATLAIPLDPVALAVVVSALVHRLVFGYPLIARRRTTPNGLLDMSPYDADDRWGDGGYETQQGIAGRRVVEVWQPSYYALSTVVALGIAAGLVSAAIGFVFESAFLAFGLALAALGLVYVDDAVSVDLSEIPALYHVALPASIATLAMGTGEPAVALAVGTVFGLVGALVGELAQRVVYAHADTHFDPGFLSLLVTSLLVGGLVAAGVFDASAVPYPTP